MPNYIIAYLGGAKPETPEQGQQQMGKWKAWVENLGAAAVNPGTPLSSIRIVGPDGSVAEGSGDDTFHGFTVVEAESLDAAIAMAQACPYLEIGGSLEVAEMMQMPGG